MVSWRPYVEGQDPWEFLGRVGRAVTGREVEVVPGAYPTASRVYPHRHMSRVTLPSAWLGREYDHCLRGALSHELLHVMHTDPDALDGISWAVYQVANGLEDARLETQCETTWPGLVHPVRLLTRGLLSVREALFFLNRRKRMAYDVATAKVQEVSLALYLLLTRYESSRVERVVNEVATAIAREVLHLAEDALLACDTAEVVEIAKKIVDELERAAQRAAENLNTPAARAYVQRFTEQLKEATRLTVEEVFVRLSLGSRPQRWAPPFYLGGGGIPFYPKDWEWDAEAPPLLPIPDRSTLVRWLMDSDPHHEIEQVLTRQHMGKLATDPADLMRAATGQSQRVFSKSLRTRRLILHSVLGNTEFVFLVEAHEWYDSASQRLILTSVASLARLLSLCHSRFIVRTWTLTRPEEEVEDALTKRRFTRALDEYHVHLRTVKGFDDRWGKKEEATLATLPWQGFNNPFEGYKFGMTWNLQMDPPVGRKRVVMCFGDACRLNIAYLSELPYATAHLRRPNHLALYVHIGSEIPDFHPLAAALSSSFDGWVQPSTPHQAVSQVIRELVLLLAG